VLRSADGLVSEPRTRKYIRAISDIGDAQTLRLAILLDFFKHGFDGDGDDGGSCIDEGSPQRETGAPKSRRRSTGAASCSRGSSDSTETTAGDKRLGVAEKIDLVCNLSRPAGWRSC